MGCDHKYLDVNARLAIEDVVRKARYPISPNARGKLDAISPRVLTDFDHCRLKGSKIARAKSGSPLLVVSDVFKVFNPRRLTEK